MRGKIIHYNGSDGKGLVSANGQQIPFQISQWRSDSAPTVNQTVELEMSEGILQSLVRVSDEVLIREKAGKLWSSLGSAGAEAAGSLKSATSGDGGLPAGMPPGLQGGVARLGKPLLAAHALFAVAALFFTYLKIDPLGMGVGVRSFSLVGLSGLSEQLGGSVGGSFLPWLAILSIAVPLFWRSRWAWLALLLPLVATLKPGVDVMFAIRKVSAGASEFDARMGRMLAEQVREMLGTGMGLWLCLATSLVIAGFALKRALLPSNESIHVTESAS